MRSSKARFEKMNMNKIEFNSSLVLALMFNAAAWMWVWCVGRILFP